MSAASAEPVSGFETEVRGAELSTNEAMWTFFSTIHTSERSSAGLGLLILKNSVGLSDSESQKLLADIDASVEELGRRVMSRRKDWCAQNTAAPSRGEIAGYFSSRRPAISTIQSNL